MSYTVTLCDRNFRNVVHSGITLNALTPGGTLLASQPNSSMGGRYGAVLSFTPAQRRFYLEIHAIPAGYATLVLRDLNGDRHPQTINVILLPVPASGTGTGSSPTTTRDIRPYIQNQSWLDDEKDAVNTAISALSILNGMPGSQLRTTRGAIEDMLVGLGISPSLIP
jgi:hypothetical protein